MADFRVIMTLVFKGRSYPGRSWPDGRAHNVLSCKCPQDPLCGVLRLMWKPGNSPTYSTAAFVTSPNPPETQSCTSTSPPPLHHSCPSTAELPHTPKRRKNKHGDTRARRRTWGAFVGLRRCGGSNL